MTWDALEAHELRGAQNFGFPYKGDGAQRAPGASAGWGTNGKMSEYHAAIALAALDRWPETRDRYLQLFDWYDTHLPTTVTKQRRPRGVYPIMAVKLPVPAEPVLEKMKAAEIECRRWYTPIMTEHPMFQKLGNREQRRAGKYDIPVTADLQEHLLGLPWHLHLSEADVKEVCEKLEEALR